MKWIVRGKKHCRLFYNTADAHFHIINTFVMAFFNIQKIPNRQLLGHSYISYFTLLPNKLGIFNLLWNDEQHTVKVLFSKGNVLEVDNCSKKENQTIISGLKEGEAMT